MGVGCVRVCVRACVCVCVRVTFVELLTCWWFWMRHPKTLLLQYIGQLPNDQVCVCMCDMLWEIPLCKLQLLMAWLVCQ